MCQSKAQGGKRCAAHAPTNVAVAAYVAASSDLDEKQVKSLLAQLRKEHADAPDPDPIQALAFIDHLATRAERDPWLTENQREQVMGALHAASADIEAGNVPDGPSLAALENVEKRALAAQDALDTVLLTAAQCQRISPDRMAAKFRHWRRNPENYQDVTAPQQMIPTEDLPLPSDRKTAKALRKLQWETYLAQRLPVFVYGTLREGQVNRGRFGSAVDASARGTLSGVAIYGPDRGFPYACEAEDGAVTVGDLVTVSGDVDGDRARDSLDALEGFNSDWPDQSHYRRVVRDVVTTCPSTGEPVTRRAWTYLAGEWAQGNLGDMTRVEDGDWVAAKDAYRASNSRYGY